MHVIEPQICPTPIFHLFFLAYLSSLWLISWDCDTVDEAHVVSYVYGTVIAEKSLQHCLAVGIISM